MSEDIYREIILDHYRNPRNKGRISDADVSFHDSNPLCGDEIDIHLKVEDNIVKDIKFEGRGCAISQASASMLTEISSEAHDIDCRLREDAIHLIEGVGDDPTRVRRWLRGCCVAVLCGGRLAQFRAGLRT